MKIPYVDLSLQWKKEKKDLSPIINRVFEKGNYVIGKEVDIFEKNVANNLQAAYVLLSDQSPQPQKTYYWSKFFGITIIL
mgnify:CR=1 FL=1